MTSEFGRALRHDIVYHPPIFLNNIKDFLQLVRVNLDRQPGYHPVQ